MNGTDAASAGQDDARGRPQDTGPPTAANQNEGAKAPRSDSDQHIEAEEGATQLNQVNNFFDAVNVAAIGYSRGEGQYGKRLFTRKSGTLTREDAAPSLRYYLEPAAFDQAMQVLARHHLVALTGQEGCGKKAGTLQLARRTCPGTEKYTLLPPTKSLVELRDYKYGSGEMCLLHDWVPVSGEHRAAAKFDLDQLLGCLIKASAYLAITFEGAGDLEVLLGEMCVPWTAPEPAALFDHCVGSRLDLPCGEEEFQQLRERASELRSPRLIVSLAEAAVKDVKIALDQASEQEGRGVTEWFNLEPVRWKVHTAAALTFLSGIGERNFERLLALLAEISEGNGASDSDDEQNATLPDERPHVQSRWRRAKQAGLDTFIVERDPQTPVGAEHKPGFSTNACRMHFMIELNRRYGHELWAPVCDWLFVIADQPFGEVQIAAGYGLAILARCALDEVTDTYLTPWSVGGLRHRLMAVSVLWSMAEDDQLAAAALKIAVSWVRNKGAERAITAAIAFGGTLGQRYPSEAMRWLWVLARRGERISPVARLSMGQLFAMEAESDAEKSIVLRFLLQKLRPLLSQDASAHDRRAALDLVNSVLAASQPSSDTLVAAQVIRTKPADFCQLGELWAAVLNIQRCREDAIISLRRALTALADGPDSIELASRLGNAILPMLSSRSLELLNRELPNPRRARKVSARILAAFLDAQRQVIGADQ
jgi:hypothetical protein